MKIDLIEIISTMKFLFYQKLLPLLKQNYKRIQPSGLLLHMSRLTNMHWWCGFSHKIYTKHFQIRHDLNMSVPACENLWIEINQAKKHYHCSLQTSST